MLGETGVDRCHLCGRELEGRACPHCDRRSEGWTARLGALLRLHDDFWLPVVAVLAVVVAIAVIVLASLRVRSQVGPATSSPGPAPGTSSAAVDPSTPGASTFWVLGAGTDASGQRARFGYAFVVRTGADSSDLLTDYDLVVATFVRGDRTVDLGRGERTFTATIVAVSTDPHVALLRIGGRFPALPIATRSPDAGDTVVLGEGGIVPSPRASVVARSAAGHPGHLSFSLAVDGSDDGTPLLNLAGRVVGIAVPSAPFGPADVGYAIPIRAGCLAVQAC